MKGLKKIFIPDEIVQSFLDIDFSKLIQKGYKNLIVDVEDTIVKKNEWDIYPQTLEFIERLKKTGFKICLLTNSFYFGKVRDVAKKLNLPSINPAFKPLPFSFYSAMKILSSEPSNTAVVGDQLFMDVFGGKIVGAYTIMVKHSSQEKNFFRRLMRRLEEFILKPG